jgi:phosphocarrier protein HPr
VKSGDEIELICDGVDEKEALERLTAEIASGLGQ